ncbi:MAG TPA: hypothetical protein ENN99_16630 [Chloroflexi bacterium]|nr:hypothetical protein [Chloroflexota bacterium]
MQTWEIEAQERQMYNQTPLIGFWIRRRALRRLADDGSMGAVRALARVVTRSDDRRVREIARESLRQLVDWRGISAACEVWAETRHPDLTALLLENEWVASTPPAVKVLTALKVGRLDQVTREDVRFVEPLLEASVDDDSIIAERAQEALRGLESAEAREAICRYVVTGEGEPRSLALQIALEAGYEPQDERERAVFLFVTEQWQRYEALDFDHRLLRTAYAVADPSLRRRIREKMRVAGRADFLTAMAGENYVARAAEMTPAELELLIQTLTEHSDWPSLWQLALQIPLAWSLNVVTRLAREAWTPEGGEAAQLFRELIGILEAGGMLGPSLPVQWDVEEIERVVPPALLQARARVPGRINDVTFSPTRPVIAVGTGQRRVVVWNYQHAHREYVLSGFDHSIGCVAFTGDGRLLWGERTSGTDVPCAIYCWSDERPDDPPVVLGQHAGSVTALAPVGATQVLSAGRDQDLVLWDVSAGQELVRRRLYYWARAVGISPSLDRVALLHRGLDLARLPDLQHLKVGSGSSVGRCAAFLPSSSDGTAPSIGDTILMGRYNGDVSIYQGGTSYWITRKTKPFTHHQGRVEGVEVLSERSVVITAGSEGIVRFTRVLLPLPADGSIGGEMIGEVEVPLGQVTSLHVSPDGAFMVLGNSEAVLSLWDLRTLDARRLFAQPLGQATAADLGALSVLMGSEQLPSPAHTALRFADRVLRHQARFDIEIGEGLTIMAGEFDIEIE